MTRDAADPAAVLSGVGCGRLVVLVGPSGPGKDSMMVEAMKRLNANPRFGLVRRMITRPMEAGGETHNFKPDFCIDSDRPLEDAVDRLMEFLAQCAMGIDPLRLSSFRAP